MDYIVSVHKKVPLKSLEPYHNIERFLAMCKQCPSYNRVWSCPPYGFAAEDLLAGYETIDLYGTKIMFDAAARRACRDKDSATAYSQAALDKAKRRANNKVLALEKNQKESLALSCGGCSLCAQCTRPQGIACRHPELIRPSLESLGFDVGAIAKDILGIKLLWVEDRLPEYMTLVTALMTP